MNAVAVLKKELAQRKVAPTLNKGETPPVLRKQSSSSSHRSAARVAEEMDRMDKILETSRKQQLKEYTDTNSIHRKRVLDSDNPATLPSTATPESKRKLSASANSRNPDEMMEPPRLVSSDDYEDEGNTSNSFSTEVSQKTSPQTKPLDSAEDSPLQRLGKRLQSSASARALERHAVSPLVRGPSNRDDSEAELEDTFALEFGTESSTSDVFPSSASPKLIRNARNGIDFNEGFPGDITADIVRNNHANFHQSPTLGNFQETPELDDDDVLVPAEGDEFVSLNQEPSPVTQMSSIDAFEASFQTDFPNTFSPKDGEEKKNGDETYNPFFSSPQKTLRKIEPQNGVRLATATVVSASPDESEEDTPSPGSSQGSGIRERATAAYLRNASRWKDASSGGDPPGRDRTSTRRFGPLGAQTRMTRSPQSPVVLSPALKPRSPRPSPGSLKPAELVPKSGINRIALPSLKKETKDQPTKSVSVIKSTYESPVTSPKKARIVSPTRPNDSQLPSPLQPKELDRPEKRTFDAVRARYEQAVEPRSKSSSSNELHPQVKPEVALGQGIDERKVASSIHNRIAVYTEMASSKSLKSSNLPFDEEDGGEIPMRSRLSSPAATAEADVSLDPPFRPLAATGNGEY